MLLLESIDLSGTTVRWHGHSTVSMAFPQTRVYVDPYRLHGVWPDATHILITHPHHDHLDPDTIRKLDDGSTDVICPASVSIDDLPVPAQRITQLAPGESWSAEQRPLTVRATHAYNPEKRFHPKQNHWLGYVVETESTRIFHAGDTGSIPLKLNEPVDLGFVPVDGIYTMQARDAAKWTDAIAVHSACPIHFGTERGSITDSVRFRRSLEKTTPVHLEETRLSV